MTSTLRGAVLAAFTLAALVAAGCGGPRRPLTVWGYSDWYEKGSGGLLGPFEHAQKRCLAEVGIDDPAAVAPESPEESRFVQCMNAAGWCTHAYNCEKPAG